MSDYGIFTTKALIGIHLFPLLFRVYTYSIPAMQAYIRLNKIPLSDGHSKARAGRRPVTGRGYLISKTAEPVQEHYFPSFYVNQIKWQTLTDREAGKYHGEDVISRLIEDHLIVLPMVGHRRSLPGEELQGIDGWLIPVETPYQLKTELYEETGNLFIQDSESGHDPNVTREGAVRFKPLP